MIFFNCQNWYVFLKESLSGLYFSGKVWCKILRILQWFAFAFPFAFGSFVFDIGY